MKIIFKDKATEEEKREVIREAELRKLNPRNCPEGITIEPENGNWCVFNPDNFSCIAEIIKD